jgi:hypothetical protein
MSVGLVRVRFIIVAARTKKDYTAKAKNAPHVF